MKTRYPGKLADPAVRHARAVKAAQARTTIDYHVRAITRRADELTPQHAAELARALTRAISQHANVDDGLVLDATGLLDCGEA